MKVKEYCTSMRSYLRNIEFDLKRMKMNAKTKQDLLFYNDILRQLSDIRKETGAMVSGVINLKKNTQKSPNIAKKYRPRNKPMIPSKKPRSKPKSMETIKQSTSLKNKIAKFEREIDKIKAQ